MIAHCDCEDNMLDSLCLPFESASHNELRRGKAGGNRPLIHGRVEKDYYIETIFLMPWGIWYSKLVKV